MHFIYTTVLAWYFLSAYAKVNPTVSPTAYHALCAPAQTIRAIMQTHPNDLLYQHPTKNRVLRELPPALTISYLTYCSKRYGNIPSLEVLQQGLGWGFIEKIKNHFHYRHEVTFIYHLTATWSKFYELKQILIFLGKVFIATMSFSTALILLLRISELEKITKNLAGKARIIQAILERHPLELAIRHEGFLINPHRTVSRFGGNSFELGGNF